MESEPKSRFGFVGGALAGVGLVALVAVGWSLGGADDRGGADNSEVAFVEEAVQSSVVRQSEEASPHGSAEAETISDPEVEALRLELAAQPDRLDLRKRLAIQLLRRAQFYPAFDEAKLILEVAPDDVDGLFVTAAIRVRMGQPSRALPLLERVLEQVPDHVPALTAKGQALLKAGHTEQAVATWERALELSGGVNSQVEEMLRSVPVGTPAP